MTLKLVFIISQISGAIVSQVTLIFSVILFLLSHTVAEAQCGTEFFLQLADEVSKSGLKCLESNNLVTKLTRQLEVSNKQLKTAKGRKKLRLQAQIKVIKRTLFAEGRAQKYACNEAKVTKQKEQSVKEYCSSLPILYPTNGGPPYDKFHPEIQPYYQWQLGLEVLQDQIPPEWILGAWVHHGNNVGSASESFKFRPDGTYAIEYKILWDSEGPIASCYVETAIEIGTYVFDGKNLTLTSSNRAGAWAFNSGDICPLELAPFDNKPEQNLIHKFKVSLTEATYSPITLPLEDREIIKRYVLLLESGEINPLCDIIHTANYCIYYDKDPELWGPVRLQLIN